MVGTPLGVLFFGGLRSEGDVGFNDTWMWNGSTWTQMHPRRAPSARIGATMVWDGQHQQVLLFGGETPAGRHPAVFLKDTWAWRQGDWVELHPSTSPPARAGAAAQESRRDRGVLLFGGRYDDNVYTTLGDTWLWNGITWQAITATPSPPSSDSVPLVADPATGALILVSDHFTAPNHFAEGSPPDTNEVWEWRSGRWVAVTVTGPAPLPRSAFAVGVDPGGGRFILFGGYGGGQGGDTGYGDTWALTEAADR